MNKATSYELFGNVLTFRARPSDGAPVLLISCRTAPGAGAPPNHHAGDEESFCIIRGTYEFTVADQTRHCTAGDTVHIPTGAVHSFRNIGADTAEMLIMNHPGRQHEAMFSTLGQPVPLGAEPQAPAGPPPAEAMRALIAAAAACGVEILPPG